jgi:hypothetical protein
MAQNIEDVDMKIRFAKTLKSSIFLVPLMILAQAIYAQETPKESSGQQLRGAVMMAYSHIPQAFEGEKTVAIIPAWGLDLGYHFSQKWAIYTQTDIKLQSFEVEDKDEVVLTRNFPVSVALLGQFHLVKHWAIFVGPGIEFERSKNLWIFKLGTEYNFEMSEILEIGVGLIYENREELYDGWTFGVTFNYRLWKPNK